MIDKLSIYGSTGFVGSSFSSMYECEKIPRNSREPETDNVLYFISTVTNYNVLDDSFVDVDTNLSVLLETLDACRKRKVEVFNFISSWFVYGNTDLPASEDSYCDPRGFYSITKRCAEQLIISYCETFEMNYRILRLCNVYGGSDRKASKKRNALQFLIENIKSDKEIQLYSDGEFYRNFMHVSDVCRAIKLVCDRGEQNSIYNIGSIHNYVFKDLIQIAIEETNSKSEITSIEPPRFHELVQVKNMKLDTKKLYSLGFEERIIIEEGIRDLCKK